MYEQKNFSKGGVIKVKWGPGKQQQSLFGFSHLWGKDEQDRLKKKNSPNSISSQTESGWETVDSYTVMPISQPYRITSNPQKYSTLPSEPMNPPA